MTFRMVLAFCIYFIAQTAFSTQVNAQAEASAQCRELFSKSRLQGVVPNAPGGGRDALMRLLVSQLEKRHGFASASVANIPGGRSVPALLAVANPQDGDLTIGIFNVHEIILPGIDDAKRPPRQDFVLLGTAVSEPVVWMMRLGTDVLKTAGQRLILGTSSFNQAVVFDFLIPTEVLGAKAEVISSYGGSGEQIAALLRGDIDVVSVRLSTTKKAVKSGGLSAVVALTDGPLPDSPDLPYFAGAGGIAEQALAKADPAGRDRLETLAAAAATLSSTMLTISTSSHLDGQAQKCLGDAVEAVLLSDAFAAEANDLKQFVAPLDRVQTEAAVGRMLDIYEKVKDDVDAALAQILKEQ